jgi:hypothetical protein
MGHKVRWAVWFGFVAIWTILLLLPAGPATDSLTDIEFVADKKFFLFKSLHISAYAVMTILSGWLRIQARFRWLLVFFLMGHATLTEILQLGIEGRTGALHDVGFDNVGIAIGLALSWKWWVKKDDE